jgi:hypothetical protein
VVAEWRTRDIDLTGNQEAKGYKAPGRPAPVQRVNGTILLALMGGSWEEIFEISSMLDGMEHVLRWSDALQKVEELEFTGLVQLADCITVNNTLQELLHKAFDKDTGKLDGVTFPNVGACEAVCGR